MRATREPGLRTIALGAWLALAACAGPGRPQPDASAPLAPAVRLADVVDGTPEAEVVDELLALYADLSARDWEAFADHFWGGATLTSVWQPRDEDQPRVVVTSVPDFVRQAPDGPGSREIFEERMLDAELRVHHELAHVWSRFAARFGDPGQVLEWTGVDAFTLMRHEGRWRVVSVCYVADREFGAGAAEQQASGSDDADA